MGVAVYTSLDYKKYNFSLSVMVTDSFHIPIVFYVLSVSNLAKIKNVSAFLPLEFESLF